MADRHSAAKSYYMRLAMWIVILYTVWCFAPVGYAALSYRWAVNSSVVTAGEERQGTDELHATLMRRSFELGIPLKEEDVTVVRDPVRQVITATYFYVQPVNFAGHTFHLNFHGDSTAASYNRN